MRFECLILLNNKKYLVKNKFFKNAKISSDYKKYKKNKNSPNTVETDAESDFHHVLRDFRVVTDKQFPTPKQPSHNAQFDQISALLLQLHRHPLLDRHHRRRLVGNFHIFLRQHEIELDGVLQHFVDLQAAFAEHVDEHAVASVHVVLVNRRDDDSFGHIQLREVIKNVLVGAEGDGLRDDVGEVLVDGIGEVVHVEPAAALLAVDLAVEVVLRPIVFLLQALQMRRRLHVVVVHLVPLEEVLALRALSGVDPNPRQVLNSNDLQVVEDVVHLLEEVNQVVGALRLHLRVHVVAVLLQQHAHHQIAVRGDEQENFVRRRVVVHVERLIILREHPPDDGDLAYQAVLVEQLEAGVPDEHLDILHVHLTEVRADQRRLVEQTRADHVELPEQFHQRFVPVAVVHRLQLAQRIVDPQHDFLRKWNKSAGCEKLLEVVDRRAVLQQLDFYHLADREKFLEVVVGGEVWVNEVEELHQARRVLAGIKHFCVIRVEAQEDELTVTSECVSHIKVCVVNFDRRELRGAEGSAHDGRDG